MGLNYLVRDLPHIFNAGITFNSAVTANSTFTAAQLTATTFSGADTYRGIATIASGDTTVIVSATGVNSGYPVLVTLGPTTVASHRDVVLSVSSRVTGVSFLVEANKATVGSQEVCWFVVN